MKKRKRKDKSKRTIVTPCTIIIWTTNLNRLKFNLQNITERSHNQDMLPQVKANHNWTEKKWNRLKVIPHQLLRQRTNIRLKEMEIMYHQMLYNRTQVIWQWWKQRALEIWLSNKQQTHIIHLWRASRMLIEIGKVLRNQQYSIKTSLIVVQ